MPCHAAFAADDNATQTGYGKQETCAPAARMMYPAPRHVAEPVFGVPLQAQTSALTKNEPTPVHLELPGIRMSQGMSMMASVPCLVAAAEVRHGLAGIL